MKQKLPFFIFALIATTISASAQSVKELIAQNPYLAGNQSVAYQAPADESLTAAPQGYQPFYMSHYGRHGSRYDIGNVYSHTCNILQRAADDGKLTTLGLHTLANAIQLRDDASGRDGELTPLGAQQHREIASRMYANFPEIFAKASTTIDAHATVVIRCILSMENALLQLSALNPNLTIRHDASQHDMYYMNYSDRHLDSLHRAVEGAQHKFAATKVHPERLMRTLFNDDAYWQKQPFYAPSLMKSLFSLAVHAQNTELRHTMDMINLFTTDELYDLWQTGNSFWYLNCCNSPLTSGKMPYTQRNLLRNIIHEADSCINLHHPSASLRYGHDGMVLPLACLMELDDCNASLELSELAQKEWCDFRIIPMAANIQIIFFRSTDTRKPLLVKVLLNEHEARLPIASDIVPYYRWSDLRQYYLAKLDNYNE